MTQRKEDEIMAEYLLKGGKMLEKTCRQCGCPQFEYRKKTFCVVCAERDQEKKKELSRQDGPGAGSPHKAGSPPPGAGTGDAADRGGSIGPALTATILNLCRRIQDEEDPDRCLVLMDAVKAGTEALQVLHQL